MGLILAILIGGVAGWLAGKIMKSGTGGLLWNIILGILGGFVGTWLLQFVHIPFASSWIGTIIISTVGAIALIIASNIFFKRKRNGRR
jgi:uncharacterized membrane protein YeaQ/YmgE (transglycosylase-associated protein family)